MRRPKPPPEHSSGDLFDWRDKRDVAMERVKVNAGEVFHTRACSFVVAYLRSSGPTSGELISLAAKGAGIVPHDDRAFGPVYLALVRDKLIEKCGTARRVRGHGTSGGNVWRLTPK